MPTTKWLSYSLTLCGLIIGSIMPSYANDLTPLDITNKIIHHADASLQPKETLVQWYYAVDGLIETAKQQ